MHKRYALKQMHKKQMQTYAKDSKCAKCATKMQRMQKVLKCKRYAKEMLNICTAYAKQMHNRDANNRCTKNRCKICKRFIRCKIC